VNDEFLAGALIFKSAAKRCSVDWSLTMASSSDARGVAESVSQMSEVLSRCQRSAPPPPDTVHASLIPKRERYPGNSAA